MFCFRYGDLDAFEVLRTRIQTFENDRADEFKHHNRLFYFTIPPNVFDETVGACFCLHCIALLHSEMCAPHEFIFLLILTGASHQGKGHARRVKGMDTAHR